MPAHKKTTRKKPQLALSKSIEPEIKKEPEIIEESKKEVQLEEETKKEVQIEEIQICIQHIETKYDLNWYYMRIKILSLKHLPEKIWFAYVKFWNETFNKIDIDLEEVRIKIEEIDYGRKLSS